MADIVSSEAWDDAAYNFLTSPPFIPDMYVALLGVPLTIQYFSPYSSFHPIIAPGYSDIHLPFSGWTISHPTASKFSHPMVTFNITGPGSPPQTIYGYYFHYPAESVWLWGANLPTPFAIPAPGVTVNITPSFQVQTCP